MRLASIVVWCSALALVPFVDIRATLADVATAKWSLVEDSDPMKGTKDKIAIASFNMDKGGTIDAELRCVNNEAKGSLDLSFLLEGNKLILSQEGNSLSTPVRVKLDDGAPLERMSAIKKYRNVVNFSYLAPNEKNSWFIAAEMLGRKTTVFTRNVILFKKMLVEFSLQNGPSILSIDATTPAFKYVVDNCQP